MIQYSIVNPNLTIIQIHLYSCPNFSQCLWPVQKILKKSKRL